jgi:DegV family protein with EDD domain
VVKIVTDSTADIPADMATRLGITVIPSYVVFGTETYLDGVELTKQQFYEKLAATRMIPTTATPPPGAYEDAYRQLAKETDEIVSIHLAAGLSALYSSAALAAKSISEARVTVVDSGQLTMGYGWIAIIAAEAAQRGANHEQIVTLVEGVKDRSRVLAVLDTLDFLHRSGRVDWAQAMIGAVLRVKPIVEVRAGEVVLVERSRTQKRSLVQLMTLIRALGSLERAIILHTDAAELAERVADELQVIDPGWERLIGHAGVTVASHVGPGAVGIACVTSD